MQIEMQIERWREESFNRPLEDKKIGYPESSSKKQPYKGQFRLGRVMALYLVARELGLSMKILGEEGDIIPVKNGSPIEVRNGFAYVELDTGKDPRKFWKEVDHITPPPFLQKP